jgi:hypothetical protein
VATRAQTLDQRQFVDDPLAAQVSREGAAAGVGAAAFAGRLAGRVGRCRPRRDGLEVEEEQLAGVEAFGALAVQAAEQSIDAVFQFADARLLGLGGGQQLLDHLLEQGRVVGQVGQRGAHASIVVHGGQNTSIKETRNSQSVAAAEGPCRSGKR